MQISMPVKVGWIVCLIWAVAQLEWYKRLRAEEFEELEEESRPAPARREAVAHSAPAPEFEPLEFDDRSVEGVDLAKADTLTEGDGLDLPEDPFADLRDDPFDTAVDPLAPSTEVAATDGSLADSLADDDDDLWSRVVGGNGEDFVSDERSQDALHAKPAKAG